MNEKAAYYITKLQLEPHPEGGYYKEVYRAGEIYFAEHLPGRYSGDRNFSTSIYFLLEGRQISKFHKLDSDELWHFYDGSSVRIYILKESKGLSEIVLGNDLNKGEMFQTTIERGNWFAAEVIDKSSYSLIGCTVSPGFDFKDFNLANRKELIARFPSNEELIRLFTNA